MVVCPTCFKTLYRLPHSPKFADAQYTVPIGNLDLTFDVSMNQAKVPSSSSFTVYKDGVPITPTVSGWASATVLSFTMGAGVPTDVHVELSVSDPNLESLTGVTCQAKQRIKAHT